MSVSDLVAIFSPIVSGVFMLVQFFLARRAKKSDEEAAQRMEDFRKLRDQVDRLMQGMQIQDAKTYGALHAILGRDSSLDLEKPGGTLLAVVSLAVDAAKDADTLKADIDDFRAQIKKIQVETANLVGDVSDARSASRKVSRLKDEIQATLRQMRDDIDGLDLKFSTKFVTKGEWSQAHESVRSELKRMGETTDNLNVSLQALHRLFEQLSGFVLSGGAK